MRNKTQTLALAASLVFIGALSSAQAEDAGITVADDQGAAYHQQLNRVRETIKHGDQAQVNREMTGLFEMIDAVQLKVPDTLTSTRGDLTDDALRMLSIQDERSANSF